MRIDQAVIPISAEGRSGKRLLGLELLERVLLTASQAGVSHFFLTGADEAEGAAILAALARDKRFRERDIRPEFIPLSALAGLVRQGRIGEGFWLLAEDLVFAPAVMERAARIRLTGKSGLAVVNHGGTDGAAAYAGLALLPASALEGLARALAEPGTSGELPEEAAPRDRRVEMEARPDFCERAASRDSMRRARRYLIGTARKPTDGFFSRNFNRYISTFLTRQLLKLDVTPVQISFVVLAVGLLSGWIEGRGGYRNALVGALLFELASIIDGCDGENARLTFRGSKLGGTLDITGDAATFVFFFLNLPIGLYRSTRSDLWLVLGAVSFLSMFLFYLQVGKYTKRTGIGNNIIAIVKDIEKGTGQPGLAGMFDRLAAWIAPVFRRDFFATGALVFIALGGAPLLMLVIAILSPLETVYMFFYARRRLREVEAEA